ncbi:hypothetical protein WMO75_13560, partial [Blautia sp. CLA-AA-H95]
KSNMQLKYSNYVAFSHDHGFAVNNSGLVINLGYHQNPTDNIGLGDLCVESDAGLEITGVSITD